MLPPTSNSFLILLDHVTFIVIIKARTESGAGLSLFIILPREGSIDNGNFGTDDGINGIFSQQIQYRTLMGYWQAYLCCWTAIHQYQISLFSLCDEEQPFVYRVLRMNQCMHSFRSMYSAKAVCSNVYIFKTVQSFDLGLSVTTGAL